MHPIHHIRDVDMISHAVIDCHPLVSAKRIIHLGNSEHHGNEINENKQLFNNCINHTNKIINKIKCYICTQYYSLVCFDINSTSPITVSYTINTHQNILSPNSEIICNAPNTINNILSKTRRRNMNKVNHSANSNTSLQLLETPLTHISKQDITFPANHITTTTIIFMIRVLSRYLIGVCDWIFWICLCGKTSHTNDGGKCSSWCLKRVSI